MINDYHSLSGIIHPSHEQVITTISDILGGKGIPATVDCDEVSNIYESLKIMYDIFIFLWLSWTQNKLDRILLKGPISFQFIELC